MAAINASRVVSFKERKVHQHLEKRFLHKGKSMFWRFIQSPLHWRIVLKIKAWIETLWSNYSGTQYWLTGPEYYSTCGRCSIKDQKAPQHLENHFAMKASQCSSHLYWIKPWIQTFWSNFSGTKCWRTRPEHLSTCGRCFTKYQKTPQHLEKWFRCEGNSIFWPCYWITPWIHTFWAHCSGTQSWLAPPEYQSTTEYAVPWTPRLFKTWKTSIAMNINWYSGHF